MFLNILISGWYGSTLFCHVSEFLDLFYFYFIEFVTILEKTKRRS